MGYEIVGLCGRGFMVYLRFGTRGLRPKGFNLLGVQRK